MQVIISGQLAVVSLLSRKLQLKIVTTSPSNEIVTDLVEKDAVSYVTDQSNIKAFKVSLNTTAPLWSSDIAIFSFKTAVGHLVKVSSARNRVSFRKIGLQYAASNKD